MSSRGIVFQPEGTFTAVADCAPGMMWMADADGCRTFFNRTWLAFTGRTRDEESGDGWMRGVHPDDRARCLEGYRAGVRSSRLFELEYRLRRSDGEFRHVLDRAAPRIENGTLVGHIGSCLDIEDRKAAELALGMSETRFRLLAENASDLIYRYAVSPFRCEYMSPSAARILGFAPQDFYADRDLPLKLLHPQDRWAIDRTRESPHEMLGPLVLRWRHRNGGVVYVEHQNTPTYDDRGELVAIEGIGRDVTHRRAIEMRLRKSQSQLRRLAAGVEQARENERTQIARELHDELGQSLTAIKLELARMSRAFADDGLRPKTIDILQSIVGTIDVAIETVRRLATSLRPSALDDLGLVGAIELEASALARRTGIRCQVAGNRQVPPLHPDQITGVFRIVQEALTNVVRHASASSVRISIVGSARTMSVKVKDNGCGMNLDETADRPALGLLGMRERADMIGARLDVTSAPRKGTCVSIALNRRRRRRQGPS